MTLPAHTPTTDMLVMTYGEPDDISQESPLNTTKAGWAYSAVAAYFPQVILGPGVTLPEIDAPWDGTDGETVLTDLVADLLHLATYVGLDVEEILRRAQRDFEVEVGRGYEQ